jgi:hypothetical protein
MNGNMRSLRPQTMRTGHRTAHLFRHHIEKSSQIF